MQQSDQRRVSTPDGERFSDIGEKLRSRSNSGVRLDSYQRIVYKTLLRYQDPVSGLFPGKVGGNESWIRDNVYSVLAVWALAMAYRKHSDADEDRSKAYELEQRCVKSMRALLTCMMRQADKVESFKKTQQAKDSLHAKYALRGMTTVCGDLDYGHLQMDAVSIFILFLAQMTASGLQIVFSLDEVAFIQNVVWYIESAYRVPDFGVWERGDKSNHGNAELNASSVGMAKAALEAINDLDLFGASGGPASVIHCIADEAEKCYAVLTSMLPRESNSKECDAAILSIIGYPAFAVDDQEIVRRTRETIVQKLQGKYGMKRFLRDGYNAPAEDKSRLYYELWELAVFEHIECEWPIFFCYQILDGFFRNDDSVVETYWDMLMDVMVTSDDGSTKLMPEMYAVPHNLMDKEKEAPNSQKRNPLGRTPFLWGQSLYILCSLIREGFLQAGEIDPLCRRNVLGTEAQRPDVVVQVVVLAEDELVQQKLLSNGIEVETIDELQPIEIYPARVLSYIFSQLGRSSKLHLSGRPSTEIGVLSTSTLYQLNDRTIAFTPQTFDITAFYWALDIDLLVDIFRLDISYLAKNWKLLGRPTMVLTINADYFDADDKLSHTLAATYRKLKTGYISGTRIIVGRLQDFLTTSCTYRLQFLSALDEQMGGAATTTSYADGGGRHGDIDIGLHSFVRDFVNQRLNARPQLPGVALKRRSTIGGESTLDSDHGKKPFSKRLLSRAQREKAGGIRGIIQRTLSIQVDAAHPISVSGTKESDQMHGSSRRGGGLVPPRIVIRGSSSIYEADEQPRASSTTALHLKLASDEADDDDERASDRGSSAHQPAAPVNATPEELVQMLKETESLGEQAEIIHYLYVTKGLQWDTRINGNDNNNEGPVTVQVLLKELYDKACHMKKWWLVRHAAGMLERKSEDLARAVNDLLVRQKQITIGMPSDQEHTITRPLPPEELSRLIKRAYGNDSSTAMLTQELLMYLAMFIRTEAQLFQDLLRIRVGLIIQVMATELARAMSTADGLQAIECLLNLSPYEMKVLLYYILSGKELTVKEQPQQPLLGDLGVEGASGGARSHAPTTLITGGSHLAAGSTAGASSRRPSTGALMPEDFIHIHNVGTKAVRSGMATLRKSIQSSTRASTTIFQFQQQQQQQQHQPSSATSTNLAPPGAAAGARSTTSSALLNAVTAVAAASSTSAVNGVASASHGGETLENTGRWLRRRRLDGSLNRIPQDFYPKVWSVLSKCRGLRIADVFINPVLTREMTPYEIKFALQLENVLNRVPQPEYRQLLVEALMVLGLLVDTEPALYFRSEISIEDIVRCAYQMFLDDQRRGAGDATLCCAVVPDKNNPQPPPTGVGPNCPLSRCGGAAGVCLHFYDSAPSGRYGTITYLSRAVSLIVDICVPQLVGSHTSLRDPKLRRESQTNVADGGSPKTGATVAGRKVSATNPMFDCATQ